MLGDGNVALWLETLGMEKLAQVQKFKMCLKIAPGQVHDDLLPEDHQWPHGHVSEKKLHLLYCELIIWNMSGIYTLCWHSLEPHSKN